MLDKSVAVVASLLALLVLLSACGGDEGGETQTVFACPLTACMIGAVYCEGDALVTCVDNLGCGYLEVSACEGSCDAGACVDDAGCPEDACTIGESTCADDATLSLCVEGPGGCGASVDVACGRGQCSDGACGGGCLDEDGDGFGQGCMPGPDCDDTDDAINPDAEELCDGLDNNCDGERDDAALFADLGEACSAGLGACASEGVFVCGSNGRDVVCDAAAGTPSGERCGNQIDDDCDGQVDEGFEGIGEGCVSGLGVCAQSGLLACNAAGDGVACDASPLGDDVDELCDGVDNDCDGAVDEDFAGLGQSCTACGGSGVFECNAAMDDVVCLGGDEPLAFDICGNGIDDDCNGEVDDGYPDLGTVCEVGLGACRSVGVRVCAEDGASTRCGAQAGEANLFELCGNQIDDDCNGEIDDGFALVGTLCDVGQGACGETGVYTCAANMVDAPVCSAQEGTSSAELCDGIDNDCNNLVDETFVEKGASCTVGRGLCARTGVNICDVDGLGVVCNVQPGAPIEELCGNGVDDDCDGEMDEGFEGVGDACAAGQGVCRRSGVLECAPGGGALTCSATPGADGIEICDGLDNNCDGVVDEGDVCGTPCAPDGAEPNNRITEATPLSSGQVLEATSCYLDQDYYTLGSLNGGIPVVINALFEVADGNLNIEVYRDGELEAFGITSNDNEQVRFVTSGVGVYTFVVFQQANPMSQRYRLSVTLAGECFDDVYEENDALVTALPAEAARSYVAVVCGEDSGGDWYDLGFIEGGSLLEVDASFSQLDGNLTLVLLRRGPLTEVGRSETMTDNESIDLVVEEGGSYVAVVTQAAQSLSVDYTFRYTVTSGICLDDDFDRVQGIGDSSDNPINLARTITYPDNSSNQTNVERLALCAGDDDWFELGTFQAGATVHVNVVLERSNGAFGVELYGPSGSLVGSDTGSNALFRTVREVAGMAGSYKARVFNSIGGTAYRISNVDVAHGTCVADPFENDNFLTQAYRIEPFVAYAYQGCKPDDAMANDFDFMALGEIEAGTTITGNLFFSHAAGDVELYLVHLEDGNVTIDAQSLGSTDNEQVIFEVPTTQRYYLLGVLIADGSAQTDGNAYLVYYELE